MLRFTESVLGSDQVVAVGSCSCDLICVQGMIDLTERLLATKP